MFCIDPGWVLTDMGGPNAMLQSHVSVGGLINVISEATQETSGKFMKYDGSELPW